MLKLTNENPEIGDKVALLKDYYPNDGSFAQTDIGVVIEAYHDIKQYRVKFDHWNDFYRMGELVLVEKKS